MRLKDNFRVSQNHWYSFLPRRMQTWLVAAGIKLGFIHRYGKLEVIVKSPNGKTKKSVGYNLLVNTGIIHLGDIMAGVETTNTSIDYIEPGSGTTAANILNNDIESALTPADRLPITTATRSASAPYEVVISGFVNSTKYTRPQTINELCIYFGPDETGDLFARGVLGTPVVLNSGDTAQLTYGFVWR